LKNKNFLKHNDFKTCVKIFNKEFCANNNIYSHKKMSIIKSLSGSDCTANKIIIEKALNEGSLPICYALFPKNCCNRFLNINAALEEAKQNFNINYYLFTQKNLEAPVKVNATNISRYIIQSNINI
jgi:hypothetical protein